MADKPAKSKRRIRSVETVRQKVEKSSQEDPKGSRGKQTISAIAKPFKVAHSTGKKEYYLPLPDNKFWRFFNKRRHFIPSYFRNSFKELRDVKWPNRKETTQLTIAVFAFAIVFGIIITITDYGLDKIFKKVLLK